MKKSFKAHHTITPKGGRVASRAKRHPFRTKAKITAVPSGMDLGITPKYMRRTRAKDSRLGMGE